MSKYSISFVGAGRVAGALSQGFTDAGFHIQKIVSRTEESCRALASNCNASWATDPVFDESSDIIIVAVPDDKIKDVMADLRCGENTIVAHTAGSVGIDVFPIRFRHAGVFYPLQTFSPGRKINFSGLPFFLETSDNRSASVMTDLAGSLGARIHFTDTPARRLIHLAAVFACNFTNYMLTAADRILREAGQEYSILEPLIKETISKAAENGPPASQTGPAVRSDAGTIAKHIELLTSSPDLLHIYKEVTDSIMKYYKTMGDD